MVTHLEESREQVVVGKGKEHCIILQGQSWKKLFLITFLRAGELNMAISNWPTPVIYKNQKWSTIYPEALLDEEFSWLVDIFSFRYRTEGATKKHPVLLLCEGLLRSGPVLLQPGLLPLWLGLLKEPVGDVRRVVDAEPDADDQEHRGGRVHRQAPEVHKAFHVDQGEDDAEQDEDGAGDVGEHEDHDEENATEDKIYIVDVHRPEICK